MDPINYSAMQVQPDFLKDIGGGIALSQEIQKARDQRQLRQLSLDQMHQYQSDIGAYMKNPTAQGAAALSLKYPQQREAVKQSWDALSEADRKDQSNAGAQAYSALLSGRNDVAQNILENRIEARKNGGLDYSNESNILDIIKSNPDQAKGAVGLWLAHVSDPKSFASTFGSLGAEQRAQDKAPSELQKSQADASLASSAAANAPVKTSLDNQKSEEDIKSAQLKRQLDSFDAQIKSANSETERGQLQLARDKFVQENKLKLQDQGQAAQSSLDSFDQGLSTVSSILNHPGLSTIGSMTGKVSAMLPGTDAKDIRSMIDTLKSQQFLAAAKDMRGMGALSDAEGARIERAVASLDTDQSLPAFKNSLGVIQATLEKARNKAIASGKLPQATGGGGFIFKSPKYGNIDENMVNRVLTQNPGATRDDVLKFLGAPQ